MSILKKKTRPGIESLEDRITPTGTPSLLLPTGPVRVDQDSFSIQGKLQAVAPAAGTTVSNYRDTNNDHVFSSGDQLVASVVVPQGSQNFTVSPSLLQNADNLFFLVANDGGTDSAPLSIPTITEDSTAPTVTSINRMGDEQTSTSALQFQLVFSEPVTGVDPTDFALTSTGAVSASSTVEVTGTGTSYTVRVSNVKGTGTLGLNLIDDDTIKDILSDASQAHPLGGAGTGNGSFSGQTFSISGATGSVFFDGFDATLSSVLSSSWTVQVGSFSTSSSKAVGTSALNVASLTGFVLTDVSAQASVTVSGNNQFAGVTARYAGTGDQNMYWGTLVNRGGTLFAEIFRNLNGTWTLLGSTTLTGVSVTPAHSLRLDAVGSSLRLSIDGTLRVSVNDTALTAGRVGMRSSAGASVDNLALNASAAALAGTFTTAFDATSGGGLDASWATQVGAFSTSTSAAVGGSALNVAHLTGFLLAEVSAQASVTVSGSNQFAGVTARYAGTGDQNMYWGTLVNRGGTLFAEVLRNLNGTWTLLGSTTLTGVSVAAAHTLRFDVAGSLLRLSVDGTARVSVNDTALTTGRIGLRASSGASLDNFALNVSIPGLAGSFNTTFDATSGGGLDASWTTQVGSYSTASNAARGGSALNVASLTGFLFADVSVQASVTVSGNNQFAGVTARYAGTGDQNMYWGTLVNRGGTLFAEVLRNLNGTWTLLGSTTLTGVSVAPAHSLRFDVVGSSLRLSVDGAVRVSVTDTALTAGRIGVRSSAGGSLDSLSLNVSIPNLAGSLGVTFDAVAGGLGLDWLVQAGTFSTSSNTALGTSALNLANLVGYVLSDASVQASVTVSANNQFAGLVTRYSGQGNQNMYWGTLVNRSGTLSAEIYRILGGTATLLGSSALPGLDVTSVHTLRFDTAGSSLRLSVDGTLRVDVTDTALTSGRIGIRSSAGAILDNLFLNSVIQGAAGFVSDLFEATQNGLLNLNWLLQAGSFSTLSNTALGTAALNLANLTAYLLADIREQITVTVASNNQFAGVTARYSGPGDQNMYWGTLVNRGGTLFAEIYRNLNGTWTLLGSSTLTGLSATAAHALRFDVVGTALRLFIDGTLRVSALDSALTSGRIGLRTSAGAILDTLGLGISIQPGSGIFTIPTPAVAGQHPVATVILPALDLNLLGLEIQTSQITVAVSADADDGQLLGNLLTTATNLINLQKASDALNQILSTTVGLLNTADLGLTLTGNDDFDTRAEATTNVLALHIAPVHLDLLGALVDTTPIDVSITAHSGNGLILGNIVTDLANLFNDLPGHTLNIDTLNTALNSLLNAVNGALTGITPADVPTVLPADGQILSLTVPALDLNLLGLKLETSPITVNAAAQEGNGNLLGNVLTSLLGTLNATPDKIAQLNNTLNAVLAKVVGALNAVNLTVAPALVGALPPALQTLLSPTLIADPGATAPILDLVIASQTVGQPPVEVDLLGLNVTTSNIDAHLSAVTGDGLILGNLLYNVANLANPGGPAGLLALLDALGSGALNSTAGSEGSTAEPTTAPAPKQLLQITLDPLDLDLLGLHVKSQTITVTISAQGGDAKLLGNLLSGLSTFINFDGVGAALNNVLSTTVDLVNSVQLSLPPDSLAGGAFKTGDGTTTQVLQVDVAPVKLDLLGLLVTTSPIHLTIEAQSGTGLVLGNVVAELAHLFDNPAELTVDDVNNRLADLLTKLNTEIPGIDPAPTPPVTLDQGQFLELTLSPINLNLLGLILQTSQITVNASAVEGNGNLLGNFLTSLLNTIDATPGNLTVLNQNLNALLAKIIGVLNAADLSLPSTAISSLADVLQTLMLPLLISPTPGATTQILDLLVASPDGTQPPVEADLLGLLITTSDIDAKLLARTGDGQVLGNLLYNVANLLNPGNSTTLLYLLSQLTGI